MAEQKNFVERYGMSGLVAAVLLFASIISSFAVSQYRQGDQQTQIDNVKAQVEKYNLAVLDYKVTQLQQQVKESNDKADRILLLLK